MVGSLTRTIWFSGLLTATLSANVFGIALQKPQSYDDDGASDLGVYNYYTGMWWSRSPVSDESIWRKWGATSSHLPLPGDYDNDGKTDYATYDTDSGIWYIKENTNTTTGAGSWI